MKKTLSTLIAMILFSAASYVYAQCTDGSGNNLNCTGDTPYCCRVTCSYGTAAICCANAEVCCGKCGGPNNVWVACGCT